MIPEKMLAVLSDPRSMVAEGYRGLRTSIQRAVSSGTQSIMFVSTYSGDGKSTVCANVAAALTQLFIDVILVDCDLRRPTITRLFGAAEAKGLSNFLVSEASLDEIQIPSGVERLTIVPAGTATENPGDLLGRPALADFCKQIKEKADVIIFDTSPMAACSDALSLGQHVDSATMVINPKRWDGDVEQTIRQSLESHGISILGIVLNGTDPQEKYGYANGGRYGGYGYGYGQGGSNRPRNSPAYGYGYGYENDAEAPSGQAHSESPRKRPKSFWSKFASLWGD